MHISLYFFHFFGKILRLFIGILVINYHQFELYIKQNKKMLWGNNPYPVKIAHRTEKKHILQARVIKYENYVSKTISYSKISPGIKGVMKESKP